MTTLFLRTETTSLPRMNKKPSDPSQPRVIQLSTLLLDKQRRERGFMHECIRPDGWVIDPKTAEIHGLSTRECDRYGKRIDAVLACFIDSVRSADEIVAYNLPFHEFMIDIELDRLGDRANAARATWRRPGLKRIDAMTAAASLCNAGRSMKMTDAHLALIEKPFDDRKNPVEAIRAIARIHHAAMDRSF